MRATFLAAALACCLAPAHAQVEVNVQMPPPAPAVNFNTCAKPVWPQASLRNEETGTVTLGFLIGADGKVLDTKIIKSSGFALLDTAAQEGIARCAFKPAMADGKPQQAWMRLQYVWTLEEDPPTSPQAWQDAKTRAAGGDAKSEYELAMLYLFAPAPQQDRAEAHRLLTLAAGKGLADAQYALGMQLLPSKDKDEARRGVTLLTSAAEQGKAFAQHSLGLALISGKVVPKDLNQGVAWLRKAHAGGHPSSVAYLGTVLMMRSGTNDEVAEALAFLRIGAERLDPLALYQLGRAYEMGAGVSLDYSQAAAYYRKAVMGRSRTAMRALAALYERGQGVAQDPAEAQKLRAAAGARD